MTDIIPEINNRRARRAIGIEPVPDDVLRRICEAALLAPSCFNNQPWKFVVVRDPAILQRVKTALSGGNYWAETAPVLILVATRLDADCRLEDRRDYALFDTGIAVSHLLLQATRENVIAHPIAGYDAYELKEIVRIPGEYILGTVIVLGYPGKDLHLSPKHRAQEAANRDRNGFYHSVAFDTWTWSENDNRIIAK
jgi:nitroreductase